MTNKPAPYKLPDRVTAQIKAKNQDSLETKIKEKLENKGTFFDDIE